MAAVCRQCGDSLDRAANAAYCFPCADRRLKTRIAPKDRKRAGELAHARDCDGQIACRGCGEPIEHNIIAGKKRRPALRCDACREQHKLCKDILSGRTLAAMAVANARKTGKLPPASAHACVDCARPAECYDHRDYNLPLAVEPVCASCNVIRGPAAPFNPLLVGLLLSRLAQAGA